MLQYHSIQSSLWLSTSINFFHFISGDARLARNVKNKVYSLDLISKDPSVIACDMSNARIVFFYCLGLTKIWIVILPKWKIEWSKHVYLLNGFSFLKSWYLQTPLDSSSVDVAVFCLSLMGTNYSSFIQEAHRVLKPRSECNFFM